MFIALVIATVLLTTMCASSASQKLGKHERSVAIIGGTVGVPVRYFPVLASLELAGAAGILLGLWLEPLGVAAAAALVAYFVGHLRARDTNRAHHAGAAARVLHRRPRPPTRHPVTPLTRQPIGTRRRSAIFRNDPSPGAKARDPHSPIPIAPGPVPTAGPSGDQRSARSRLRYRWPSSLGPRVRRGPRWTRLPR